jgi:hypothetical protein
MKNVKQSMSNAKDCKQNGTVKKHKQSERVQVITEKKNKSSDNDCMKNVKQSMSNAKDCKQNGTVKKHKQSERVQVTLHQCQDFYVKK